MDEANNTETSDAGGDASAQQPTPAESRWSEPTPPPASFGQRVHGAFFGSDGLRAGWRFLLYCVMFVALALLINPLFHRFLPQARQKPQSVWVGLIAELSVLVAAVIPALVMARIEKRFAGMLEAGALDEVKALSARKLDPALPAMKAHGVPWLIRHLEGEISLGEAAAGGVMDTRRYAKRQHTWFRNQIKDWPFAGIDEAQKVLESQLTGV